MIRRIWDWLMKPAPDGCQHKWKILQWHRVFEKPDDTRPSGFIYDMQCRRCGEITQRKVGP